MRNSFGRFGMKIVKNIPKFLSLSCLFRCWISVFHLKCYDSLIFPNVVFTIGPKTNIALSLFSLLVLLLDGLFANTDRPHYLPAHRSGTQNHRRWNVTKSTKTKPIVEKFAYFAATAIKLSNQMTDRTHKVRNLARGVEEKKTNLFCQVLV